jgi:hypothetical protein
MLVKMTFTYKQGVAGLLCQDGGGREVNDGGEVLKTTSPSGARRPRKRCVETFRKRDKPNSYLAQTPGAAG